MWQDFDFAAGAARMGQLPLAQHEVEAQQAFPPARAANNSTPCVHPSTNATNKTKAFCPRRMDLFYHGFQPSAALVPSSGVNRAHRFILTPVRNRLTYPERGAVAVLAALAALTFFLPLFSIHIPIVGDEVVTGYETASKISQLTRRVRSATGHGDDDQKPSIKLPKMPGGDSGAPSSLPLSIRFSWLIPVFVIGAFIGALLTLLGSLISLGLSRIAGALGAVCGILALVHLTAMNSDMHKLLQDTLERGAGDANRNPLAGLARALGNAFIGNLNLKPGAGLYVLAGSLALAAILVYSRIISRIHLGGGRGAT